MTEQPLGQNAEVEVNDGKSQVDLETVDFKALAEQHGDAIVKYFAFAHLKPELKSVSQHFAAVAFALLRDIPRSAERTAALRKMLEAKDCAVRAALP